MDTHIRKLTYESNKREEVIKDFVKKVNGEYLNPLVFKLNGERWLVDFHPSTHSKDIIVEEKDASYYDKFLLVMEGTQQSEIVGWTDKKQLMSVPARDIYRAGRKHFVVHDTNVQDLSYFKIQDLNLKLKNEFIINQQEAENLGGLEYINGILAGLHYFTKKANIYFKDLNQRDEAMIGDKKVKIYTRDAFSDEDMLIPDKYYLNNKDIDYYILCKIKAGKYSYLGYTTKEVVDETRVVAMTGNVDMDGTGESIRRIFAEQYLNLSDFIKIYEEEIKEEVKIEEQKYFPLHMHSEFSIGDAYGKLSYITDQLKARGFKGAALTDHGTLAGVWEFQKLCLAKDLKPVIGMEAYCKINLKDEDRFHVTTIVKNKKGWENILNLQAKAVRDNFHHKPIIIYDDLLNNSEGLIITSGCMSGIFFRLINKGKILEAEELMDKVISKFKDDFYIEVQSHEINNNQEVMQKLYEISLKKNIKCIFATDTHYPKKEDIKYHEAVKAISMKKNYGEAGYDDDCFFLMQTSDIEEKLNHDKTIWMKSYVEEFLKNTFEIANKCEFKIEPGKEDDTLPKLKFEISKSEKIKQLCIEGLKKYTKYDYATPEIKARLDLELSRIIDKGYENYFLIVWDMIKWAKDNDIMVGPGRGSVGASLAAFALNITECDPIEHDLLFDRFLSVIRRDMPDCDLDFEDERRHEVFDYLKNKYGNNHCAKVVTYSRFHPKGILRDVGRIFNIPSYEVNKICSMVLERSGGDARASFSLKDTFDEFAEAKAFKEKYKDASDIAMKLESCIRHKGVHAAAMIVSEHDISSYAPITKVGGEIVTEWEKQLCEDIKLIKFTYLGLKTLSVLKDASKSANVNLPKEFNDPKVYETIFKEANTVGIFQLGTVGMQKFSAQLDISSFSDLYDATTLFRPSCLHSGQAMVYSNRKSGVEPITYFHKTLEPITEQTKGVILYQEQIMQIMNQVGGMSWATAEMARKVITKSKGKDAFNKMRAEFVNNAQRLHKMSKEESEKLFDIVSTFGSYGFNKAHAVEYSILSYWGAWLKTYYPKHFYKALLKYETDEKEIKNYSLDMKQFRVEIEYPNINKSELSYSIKDDKIYAGLNSVGGLADKIYEKIILNRPFVSFLDFKKRCKVSDKILKGLIVADAFREFKINKKMAYEGNLDKDFSQQTLFGSIKKNLTDDFSDIELSQKMFEYTSLTPRLDLKKSYDFGNYDFKDISDLPNCEGQKQYFIRGIVTDVLNKDKLLRAELTKHEHKFERHLIYLNINDGTGNIACQLNPESYERYSGLIENIKKQPVVVYGTTSKDGKKMYCNIIQMIGSENKTTDVDDIMAKTNMCANNEAIITSASPAVSKNGKSYYRIILHNGVSGMCFRFKQKLYPGLMVEYKIKQEPFIDLKVINQKV